MFSNENFDIRMFYQVYKFKNLRGQGGGCI